MTDEKIYAENASFVQAMMQENLSHARHVENERMSLAMGMTALVSGSWAVGGAAIADGMADGASGKWEQTFSALAVCAIVFVMLLIARWLNGRWNDVFSNHWNLARECYARLNDWEAGRELYPFGESTGKTGRKFTLLYRILIGTMGLLICVLICYLCGIDLHAALVG